MKSLIAVLLFTCVTLGTLSPAFGYRDLEAGVFITRDPAGFVDGPNLYTYVRQNPWTKFDPTGLREAEGSSDAEERQMEVYRNSHRGESPGEYRASQEALADKTYETVVKPGAEIGGGFVPGIGEGQDAAVIADPNAPGWQKALAAGSLTLSAWSGGFLPNAGGFIRAFGGAGADSARVAQKTSQQAAEAATATKGGVAGTALDANPTGGTKNWVNCAIATDAKLGGSLASAMPGSPTSITVLEKTLGNSFSSVSGMMDIGNSLVKAGDGARGIVYGASKTGDVGHVWNAINQKGTVRFLDGQTGAVAGRAADNFDSFTDIQFMLTNPSK